ncbi:MAG: NAD-binding protein, partial [Dehalococcoidia bacterium]
ALDAEFLRRHGSPGLAVGYHLESAGMPRLPERVHRGWKGTPPLTRRVSSLGGERLFLVGDAGGYVEPFTGEGMGWALWGALALAPLVHAGVECWDDALVRQWAQVHRARIGRDQRVCRMVAWGLRHPSITRFALGALGAMPGLARPLVRHTSATTRLQEGGRS